MTRRTRLLALAVSLMLSSAAGSAQQSASRALRDSARARLARLDGTATLPGLDSAVEVRRDRWGVPHIYARTQRDLFMAQGYVAAQDRLWQMEMWRRTGEGRLAEALGPAFVERDRIARLLRYRGDVRGEWASYAPDARAIVHAFVDGVNAYIAQVRDRPPIEFDLLGIRPEPWGYEVPLQRMGALAMTGNATSELDHARLVAAVGAERAAALWPPDPTRPLDPAPGLDLGAIDFAALAALRATFGGVGYPRVEGSNNWVVSGARTASGKPLLANDPHRTIALPSLRYLTHLVGPGWNVIGAGEPGVPGVAAGHNERVAFGFTIVGMDQQDLYVERVGACRAGGALVNQGPTRCSLYRGAWTPLQTLLDTIPVKGGPPRVVRLEFTRHGPIVGEDSARGMAYALRFVGSEPGTAGYLAQLSLGRARDWASFREAARRWKLPTENLVYADVDGNIGWVAAGLMPLRSWSGMLPVPGWEGKYEWRGFLPFDSLPSTYNPPGGAIVTANNNILPPGYRHALSYEWAPPFRHDRVRQLLDSGSKYTVADFERFQHDEYSVAASKLVPLVDGVTGLQWARGWDFVMSRHLQAPLYYELWLQQLGRRVFEPAAGAGWSTMRNHWQADDLIRVVTTPETTFFGPNPIAGRDSALRLAYQDALREVRRQMAAVHERTDSARVSAVDADRETTWGDVHRAPFRHPLAAAFDLPSVPRGGDGNTVNATGGANFLQTAGASFREVIDLADWDNSTATSTPGQSGQPGSLHYGDLLALWASGRYFPLAYSRARVERETAHVLTLVPR
ncbi:MAG TPA: penicillin acylase family protein [Gemmatimonadaceae bacterium]|nr:penicillin acylase family protein [Gemmatimonadaceae bacterium]